MDNLYLCINNMVRHCKAQLFFFIFYFKIILCGTGAASFTSRCFERVAAACEQQVATSPLNDCLPVTAVQDALSIYTGVLRFEVVTLASNKQNYED